MSGQEENASNEKNGIANPAFEPDQNKKHRRKEEPEDPFAVVLDSDCDLEQQKTNPLINILKLICVFGLLYLFICSLDFLATAFRLISGKTTGHVLQNEYIKNPVVGLMIGILVTVLVQSSSTSTSIIVSMVNSQILYIREAIPMIMGANIGTSVTNTIVSLTQIGDRDIFRRAFAGATVHDMFNWLTVITLLIVEVSFNMLEKLTDLIVDNAFVYTGKQEGTDVKILKHITEPFTKVVIKVDSKVLSGWSRDDRAFDNLTLNPCHNAKMMYPNETSKIEAKCDYLFAWLELDDTKVGIILLVVSLCLLCLALIMIVKLLKSMLKGTIASMLKRFINSNIPYVPWLTGYIAILCGALMTVVVQSSSIFTSTLTPLIGLGLISVDRAYPLTLGSNIGTTTTALLASIAGEGEGLKRSVQIALVHLFFNIIGILLFYPIPFMRFPIVLCKALGNITANYRWFAIVYLALMFFVLPTIVFLLSLGGPVVMECVGIPIIVVLAIIIIINLLQSYLPRCLPPFLRTWEFLPLPLRSLEPYDNVFLSAPCCTKCRPTEEVEDEDDRSTPSTIIVEKSIGLDNVIFVNEQSKL